MIKSAFVDIIIAHSGRFDKEVFVESGYSAALIILRYMYIGGSPTSAELPPFCFAVYPAVFPSITSATILLALRLLSAKK